MAVTFHCNRDGCETWANADEGDDEMPYEWFELYTEGRAVVWHFCSRDCLMFWSARAEPIVKFWDENWNEIKKDDGKCQ